MKHRNGVARRRLKYVEETASTQDLAPLLHRWLELFQKCVREEDYETGQTLFHKNTIGFWFGAPESNLAALVENQFRDTWGNFHQFTFDTASATIIPCERTFVVAMPWACKSRILMASDRKGVATFVLRFFETKLLCLHVHIS